MRWFSGSKYSLTCPIHYCHAYLLCYYHFLRQINIMNDDDDIKLVTIQTIDVDD